MSYILTSISVVDYLVESRWALILEYLCPCIHRTGILRRRL